MLIQFLTLAGVVISVALVATAARTQARTRQMLTQIGRDQIAYQAKLEKLQRDLKAMAPMQVRLGQRTLELEQHFEKLGLRQSHLEARSTGQRPYDQAMRQAQRGANVDQLMASCGLTASEAELLVRLHAPLQQEQRARHA